jgi:hypothetical protein
MIAILNADDTYAPGALDVVRALAPGLPRDAIIVGNCNVIDAAGTIIDVSRPEVFDIERLLCGYSYYPYPPNPSAYFYSRSLHDRCGCERDHYTMDIRFLFKLFQVAHVHRVDAVLGNYRVAPGTKTFDSLRSGRARWRNARAYIEAFWNLPHRRQLATILWIARSRYWRLARRLARPGGSRRSSR